MSRPKKQSDFMMFANHWRYNHPKMSFSEAISYCSGIWNNMTKQDREIYQQANRRYAGACKKPQNTLPEVDEAAQRVEYMKRTIERIVMAAKKSQDLENLKLIFCAFNYFTKDPNDNVYVPAEFAACEYSLQDGIKSVFSTLIDPGQLSLGLSRDAQEHSTGTHNLPLPPKAMGESNLLKLYSQMSRYLAKQCGYEPPIVFTTKELIPIVESGFRFLACRGKEDFLLQIEVFDIQYLFFILKKEKDFFEFTNDIACKFHEANDRTKYCTQSMVMRWAFTFSDYMCGDLDITMEPGKHVPATVKPNYRIHNADTWSVTLAGGSSLESFHSLASFRDLRINEPQKTRRHRLDISAISSESDLFETVDQHEEDIERQAGRRAYPHEDEDEYEPQGGRLRNPSSNSQRRFLDEFSEDNSPISSRRSSESRSYNYKDHSEIKKYQQPGGQHRNPSVGKQCRSLKEFSEDSSPNRSERSSAFAPYVAKDQKDSTFEIEECRRSDRPRRNPSSNSQRGFLEEFSEEISPISSRSSSYRVAGQKSSSSQVEEYRREGERRYKDQKCSVKYPEPVNSSLFFSDDTFEYEN
ncbi:protein maelstrom 1-like isoform X2 [Drosophila kikkawai]|uniref:Protein maelstrom 1-like isoform X2 n=1 Tax=Drosophila kikkawai TaxID=30033 RepID=A0A6P4JLH2_DROKI|nr:protein maelstrom 1-like isoform X2 [Drosophila kikkawai]